PGLRPGGQSDQAIDAFCGVSSGGSCPDGVGTPVLEAGPPSLTAITGRTDGPTAQALAASIRTGTSTPSDRPDWEWRGKLLLALV
ncbi:hypothetical protein, partial [Kutzneria sp. 744]|uniref:hypothetical protein n=1 Tax=Kutzneria sp. (strain 744) TaxID=345341 RepID=UPI0018DC2280